MFYIKLDISREPFCLRKFLPRREIEIPENDILHRGFKKFLLRGETDITFYNYRAVKLKVMIFNRGIKSHHVKKSL